MPHKTKRAACVGITFDVRKESAPNFLSAYREDLVGDIMEPNEILTEAEAAKKIVDLKPQTLAKWRLRGKGPAYLKLGGKIRYRKTDIETWMQLCRIDPAAQPARPRKHIKRKKAA
jgi:hypothetical protein